jgi:S1-C subfamily serine protease
MPVLFLLPIGVIPVVDFWPLISTQSTHVGFIMVPFAIGFQQVVRSTLPVHAIINYGKRVLLVGIVVIGLAILSLYVPIVIPFAAVIALLGRELIEISQKIREENEINMYTQRENGLVILGVIPKSPASKMNVQVGEVITKVNSVRVKTNQQFYEALQINSAFCKLEIIDENGEIRFAQTALYDGKHHQVGLLFVHQDKNNAEEVI